MNSKQKTTNKASILKFSAFLLFCALVGGIIGYFSSDVSDLIPNLLPILDSGLQHISIWLLYAGISFNIATLLFYFKGKKFANLAAQDDNAFDEANRLLSLSLILTSFTFCWVLIFFGITASSDFLSVLSTVFFLFEIVFLMVMQFQIIKITKQLAPEKRGNLMDLNFQKDWYNSCDEAEQKAIGDYAYFTFRIMNTAYPFLFCIVLILSLTYPINSLVFLLLGGLWMLQNLSYTGRSYWMECKKRTR